MIDQAIHIVKQWKGLRWSGRVTQVTGLLIEARGMTASVGQLCDIYSQYGQVRCEVVGFKEDRVLLMSLGSMQHIYPGAEVVVCEGEGRVIVGSSLLGRVLNAMGRPIDNKGALISEEYRELFAPPPHPLERRCIDTLFYSNLRAIDGLITLGQGQRIGIFGGSGVGKSMLMVRLAEGSADVNVIALIGERGREVKEFIHKRLRHVLDKTVVIVSTADQAPLLRYRGALLATAIAEFFRDQGKHVLFMMDSVTRFAFALREIGMAIGEPMTNRGYTPSVFSAFASLVERAGTNHKGSITGIYTVLAEGDHLEDPLIDQMRSLLDGHIVLSRDLLHRGHFPPIDVIRSLSRIMKDLVTIEHAQQAALFRDLYHTYYQAIEMIQIGAYIQGSDPKIEKAKQLIHALESFLKQEEREKTSFEETVDRLKKLVC